MRICTIKAIYVPMIDRASRTIVGCNRTVDLVPGEYVMSSPGWPGDYPNYVEYVKKDVRAPSCT